MYHEKPHLSNVLSFLTRKLRFGKSVEDAQFPPGAILIKAVSILTDTISTSDCPKACYVFPVKENLTYWITFLTGLLSLKLDFEQNHSTLQDKFKNLRDGDKLLLNNVAVVEFARFNENSPTIRSREHTEYTLWPGHIDKLQPYQGPKSIDKDKKIKEFLPERVIVPVDKLLEINTSGNKLFCSHSIVLVSAFGKFEDFMTDHFSCESAFKELIKPDYIGEAGILDCYNSPVKIFRDLFHLQSTIQHGYHPKLIIIDGADRLIERLSEFDRILRKKIPILVVMDLNDTEGFSYLANRDFEFFNWNQEVISSLLPEHSIDESPFSAFHQRLDNFCKSSIEFVECRNMPLESAANALLSIHTEETQKEISLLKGRAVKLLNQLSGIFYAISEEDTSAFKAQLNEIRERFKRLKMYIGDNVEKWDKFFQNTEQFIDEAAKGGIDKAAKFISRLWHAKSGVVILPTEAEVKSALLQVGTISNGIYYATVGKIINHLVPDKGFIPTWLKTKKVNQLLNSFNLNELVFFYYPFEMGFHRSLVKRNLTALGYTLDKEGTKTKYASFPLETYISGFSNLASHFPENENGSEYVDITELEWSIEKSDFNKYHSLGEISDSLSAQRVDFEDESFMYCSDSHKLLTIIKFNSDNNYKCQARKVAEMMPGDYIAIIGKDESGIDDLVSKQVSFKDLSDVKSKIKLWKECLYTHYENTGRDIYALIRELESAGCVKHKHTIKNWLFDKEIIGPASDDDLRSIGKLTGNNLLANQTVIIREAITQMKSWRRKAFYMVGDKIKKHITEANDISSIGASLIIEGLGEVTFHTIVSINRKQEEIDIRYLNKLLKPDSN